MTLDEVRAFAKWCEKEPAIRKLYLFGSRVRGDNRPDSDLDIYIERHSNAKQCPGASIESLNAEQLLSELTKQNGGYCKDNWDFSPFWWRFQWWQ